MAHAGAAATPMPGTTPGEIEHHYGLPVEFFALWLDPSLTYSCALWSGEGASLADAQAAKLRFHLDSVKLRASQHLLDIGCGWGSLLRMASDTRPSAHSVGLTLSEGQQRFIESLALDHIQVRREHWQEHLPEAPYDGIVSIGAFEHFARPEDSPAGRMAIYRRFFERCRDWLAPGGRLSLQTITYGEMLPLEANPFIQTEIFPGSELPTSDEIRAACLKTFDILAVRNDARDYQRTCDAWRSNLRHQRGAAERIVGATGLKRFEHYLRLSAIGFATGRLGLHRFLLQRRA